MTTQAYTRLEEALIEQGKEVAASESAATKLLLDLGILISSKSAVIKKPAAIHPPAPKKGAEK